VVVNLPTTGPRTLVIDRSQTYVIEALLSAPGAISLEEALELFYFEIYWD
jgi:hypothetical protein